MTLSDQDTERQLRQLRAQVAELEAKISSLTKSQTSNHTAQTEHEEEKEESGCQGTTLFDEEQNQLGRLEVERGFEEDEESVVTLIHTDQPHSPQIVPQACFTSEYGETVTIDGGEDSMDSSLKRRHLCRDCGKEFKYHCDLIRHAVIHTQMKPNLCSVCGKAFRLPGGLRRHMRMHTGEKNYKCPTCGKNYSRNETLKVHMCSHTGERPYKCDVCGKGFVTKSKVTKHVRTHIRKPYMCIDCKKCFSSESGLQNHTHISESRGLQYNDGKSFNRNQVEPRPAAPEAIRPNSPNVRTNVGSITTQEDGTSHSGASKPLVRSIREGFVDNGHLSLVLSSLLPGNDRNVPQFKTFNHTLPEQGSIEDSHRQGINNATPTHGVNGGDPPQEPMDAMPTHKVNGSDLPQVPVNAMPHQRVNDTPCLRSGDTHPQSTCEYSALSSKQNTHSNSHAEGTPEIKGVILDTVLKESFVSTDSENTPVDGGLLCNRRIPNGSKPTNASPLCDFPNITIVTFPGNTPPPCPICNKLFSEASDLTKHMYVHMNDKAPHACDVCKHTFPNTSELAVHDCSVDMLFRCSKCSATFISFCALESHAKVHHGHQQTKSSAKKKTKSYKCSVCDKMFSNASSLVVHNRSHTGERPFPCSYCDMRFVNSSACIVHTRKHTGEKPFPCKFCDQKFVDSSSRTVHTRMHTGDKPYQCPSCVKSFPTQSRLTVHVRTHTGERPYECGVCGRGFPRKFVLTVHMRTHTGEKPFKCEHCERTFTCSVDRRRHQEDVHEGRRLKCGHCGLEFKRPALNRHLRVKHKVLEKPVGDIAENINTE